MNRHYPLLASLVISLAAGCSSGDTGTSHSFQTFRENGVMVAETSGGPRYQESLFRYEEILTLDQNEDVEGSLLYQPVSYLMDESGRFYVLDFGNKRIAVFDGDGTFSHSIGREGSGPGEFLSISLISVRAGFVTALDSRQQRASVFDYSGRFIRHITISNERVSFGSMIHEGPDDTLVLLKQIYHNEHRPKIVTSWQARVYAPDGTVISTIETEPVHEATISTTVEASTGGYYLGNPGAVYVPDTGILISTGIDPVMDWYDLNGDHFKTIRLDIPPEPVTSEEHSAILSRLDQEIEEAQSPFMESITNEKRRIAEIPESKGYWCRLLVDEAGFIWAQKPYPYNLHEYPERSTYLIFSSEGEYLGITVVPTNSGTVSRGHFLAIRWDEETGTSQLIVYKIHSAVRGLGYE